VEVETSPEAANLVSGGSTMTGETAQQFAYRLRAQGQQDPNVIFAQLAEGFFGFRLKTGHRVFTLDDAVQFLYELAEAVKLSEFPEGTVFPPSAKVLQMAESKPKVTPMPQRRWDHVCPDCDHQHEEREKCNRYLGEGRFCQCPSKVTA
jgi:hypothetical protein